jgi:hypothetical protein
MLGRAYRIVLHGQVLVG